MLNAAQVNVAAGALDITSLQDSATFRSAQMSAGIRVSAANGGSVSGNFSQSREFGNYGDTLLNPQILRV